MRLLSGTRARWTAPRHGDRRAVAAGCGRSGVGNVFPGLRGGAFLHLMKTKRFSFHRHDRRRYSRPCGDVAGADEIGVCAIAARLTDKFGLAATVRFRYVSAFWAGLRSISRIDCYQRDAGECGLIAKELSELREGPSRTHGALTLLNRCPLAETLEVFDRNGARGALSLGDDVFRDDVVGMATETSLSASKPTKMFLGRTGAAPLQTCPQTEHPQARNFDRSPRMEVSVRIDGDVADSHVNPERASRFYRCAVGNLNGDVEHPLLAAQYEISLPACTVQSSAKVVSCKIGQDHATIGKNAERDTVGGLETHVTLVVGNCAVWPEVRSPGTVPLVGFADLRDGAHGHLRGQPKARAQHSIMVTLQGVLRCRLHREGFLSQPVARRVDSLHRGEEHHRLCVGRRQSGSSNQFHALSVVVNGANRKAGRVFPSVMNAEGNDV